MNTKKNKNQKPKPKPKHPLNMHYQLLPCSSPKHLVNRTMQMQLKQQPLYNFTMKQVLSLKQYYDDIKYQQTIITKFFVMGRIKQVAKGISPRNIPLLKFKLDDGTTKDWRQHKSFILYDVRHQTKLIYAMINNIYVKVGCQPKVTGLVYKTQVQLTSVGVKQIKNFNQLTQHFLACMKGSIITL